MLFSERNIYNEKPLMLNDISDNCKTRILNRFNVFFRMQLNVVPSTFILKCAGHGISSVGDKPTMGSYRQV